MGRTMISRMGSRLLWVRGRKRISSWMSGASCSRFMIWVTRARLTWPSRPISRRLRALGHLFEAEDESQQWPEHHTAIRRGRKAYQAADEMPDWEAFDVMLAELRRQLRQNSA